MRNANHIPFNAMALPPVADDMPDNLEVKDTQPQSGQGGMPSDVKGAIDNIMSAITVLRQQGDANAQKYDALNVEQLAKIGDYIAKMDELKTRMEKAETALSRPGGQTEEKKGETAEQKAHRELFHKYLGNGSGEMELKALVTSSDPNGGFFVPVAQSSEISTRQFETSPMRQRASVETIGVQATEILLDDDEAGATWTGETTTVSESDTPEVGKITIPVYEIVAEPRATQQLLEDANRNIEEWLSGKVADKFSRTENAAFISGDGVGKPRGILSYTAVTTDTYTRNGLQQVISGSAGAFTFDGLINTWMALKEFYWQGSNWFIKRASLASILQLKYGDGRYIMNPDPTQAFKFNLLGFPVDMADDMPAIQSGALAAAFGNFKRGYKIVDRQGISVLRDPFTAKPWVKFYTRKRVGGAVVNFEAIKLNKLSSS